MHNIQAAFGVLRLSYQNNIHMTSFPLDLLMNFQTQYEAQVGSFLKTIPRLKRIVVDLLPPTIFCLTPPMFKCFKEGGDMLYRQIPIDYMPIIIEIVSFSFSDQMHEFEEFLHTLKEGCMTHIDLMKQTGFINLLLTISELV